MLYLSSNIPSKMFYSSFGAEKLRIARTTTTSHAFKVSLKLLINRLIKQVHKFKHSIKCLVDNFKPSVSSVALQCLVLIV